jgi:gag-polypeptide of LTR copia-type
MVRAPNANADPDAYADWYNKDQEALLQIVMTLKDSPHNSILDANTLKECWDTLAKRYHTKGNQGTVHLMEKLFNTVLMDSEPIQGQIDQLKLMVRSLETASFTLEDKWIAGLIIAKLPESYSMLKTIFSSVNDSQQHHISLNNIIDQILADEACHI